MSNTIKVTVHARDLTEELRQLINSQKGDPIKLLGAQYRLERLTTTSTDFSDVQSCFDSLMYEIEMVRADE